MEKRIYSNKISEYAGENGGRVILLFLLFLLAIYNFITGGYSAGYNTFTLICLSPAIVLFIYAVFRWRMAAFWMLIIINYFLQMKDIHLPVPMSLPNEMLQIVFHILENVLILCSLHYLYGVGFVPLKFLTTPVILE